MNLGQNMNLVKPTHYDGRSHIKSGEHFRFSKMSSHFEHLLFKISLLDFSVHFYFSKWLCLANQHAKWSCDDISGPCVKSADSCAKTSRECSFKVILREESGQNLNLVVPTQYDGRSHVKSG